MTIDQSESWRQFDAPAHAPVRPRRSSPDSMATDGGDAIAVWRAGEIDPISYLAAIFDELPRAKRRTRG